MRRIKGNIGLFVALLINKVKTVFALKMCNMLIISPPLFRNCFDKRFRRISHRTLFVGRENRRIMFVSKYGCMVFVQDELRVLKPPQVTFRELRGDNHI